MKLLLIILLLGLPASYYLFLGFSAFNMELGDFVATRDNSTAASRQAAAEMRTVADVVEWQLRDGTRQRAFYRHSTNGAVVVYLHGSPGKASGFHKLVAVMAERGFGALVLDLPGYGESQGARRWDDAFVESVLSGLDFLESQGVSAQKIGGFGYSMGANVIARAAAVDDRITALVLLAGYTNLTDQLQHRFRRRVPGMGYFAIAAAYWSGVPVHRMDTVVLLPEINAQSVFVISGTKDHGIPIRMSKALANAAIQPQLWLVKGAGHIDFEAVAGSEFYDRIDSFWRKTFVTNLVE